MAAVSSYSDALGCGLLCSEELAGAMHSERLPPPLQSAFHGNNTNALCCFSLTGANFNKRGGGAEIVYQGRRAESKRLALCLEVVCLVLVFRVESLLQRPVSTNFVATFQ